MQGIGKGVAGRGSRITSRPDVPLYSCSGGSGVKIHRRVVGADTGIRSGTDGRSRSDGQQHGTDYSRTVVAGSRQAQGNRTIADVSSRRLIVGGKRSSRWLEGRSRSGRT